MSKKKESLQKKYKALLKAHHDLMNDRDKAKSLLQSLWNWKNTDEVQAAFALTTMHSSCRVSSKFCNKIEALNRNILKYLGEPKPEDFDAT